MSTKILLVEDEKLAQAHLVRILTQLDSEIEILHISESVAQTVLWLKAHKPDLIFMDIQLIDGLSFSIFEQIELTIPIIFTTAYDEYAIKAFKVNSIDYLLKPIDAEDVRLALAKYKQLLTQQTPFPIADFLQVFQQARKTYQSRFMVHKGEKLMSVATEQIAYFEGDDRYVFLVKKDGSRFIVEYRLADLTEILDPKLFFRLNRSFIAHFDSIQNMLNLSKSRIKVELNPPTKRDIIISNDNNNTFKQWLNG